MKNIHVLPTRLASEYYITKEGKLEESYSLRRGGAVHFYITTNDEKIKEGDWFHIPNQMLGYEHISNEWSADLKSVYAKKIILTTDQDLIKDGVQAIDDEFLEWFVKNPSCEEVEVETKDLEDIERELNIYGHDIGLTDDELRDWIKSGGDYYKIIIPKEETKHSKVLSENGNELFFDEQFNLIKEEPKQDALNHFLSTSSVIVKDPQKWDFNKQETLEEASEKYNPRFNRLTKKEIFEAGVKWQQERSCSEEEVIAFANYCVELQYNSFKTGEDIEVESMEDLLEQFNLKK
jgi:hypothetical protein